MNYLKKIVKRMKWRMKEHVVPDEFIEYMKIELERELDPESVLFFRHHLNSVNLLHKILFRGLRATDDKNKDLVMSAFFADMTDYALGLGWRPIDATAPFSDLLEIFSKTYRDAGRLISRATITFLGLENELR